MKYVEERRKNRGNAVNKIRASMKNLQFGALAKAETIR